MSTILVEILGDWINDYTLCSSRSNLALDRIVMINI